VNSTLPVPVALLSGLTAEQKEAVGRWWVNVPPHLQDELRSHWEAEADTCAFSQVPGVDGLEWKDVPIAIGARFLPKDGDDDEADGWNVDFYEYLVNNPELAIHVNNITYHICRSHPAARAALAKGLIPASFDCPLANADCPMKKLLAVAPGRSLSLFGII